MSDAEARADEGRVPDLMIEKLALGELPDARAGALRQRLGAEADERLAAIERSNAEILQEHPPGEVAAEVRRRLARQHAGAANARPGWFSWAPVAVAAGVMLVWWVGRGVDGPGGTPDSGPAVIAEADVEALPAKGPGADGGAPPEQIFLKGDPVLAIDRVHDGRPQRLRERDAVTVGDRLQVTYNAKGAQQGVVVSIDGAGVATLHFPASETDDPRLAHGGPVPLPESYELDDAPGFERFFFVTVDVPQPRLPVAQVLEAARALASSDAAREGTLALPSEWRQQSILLRK